MRVAHIITRMIVGGAQENTLLNCLDLRQHWGDEVVLVTGPSMGPEGKLLDQGGAAELDTQVIESLQRAISPRRDFTALNALKKFIGTYKPDVVHTHSAKGGILGRQAAWSMQVPAIIHTVHGAPFYPYQNAIVRNFYRMCETWAAKRCHHLISVADAMTDLMVSAGVAPREKFSTIYSGMDTQPYLRSESERSAARQRFELQPDDIVIGKIARLFELKGHEFVLKAAPAIVAKCPKVKFLFVGDGNLRDSLTREIANLGLQRHFIFAGLVSPNEVPNCVAAMDILVHTSLREGLARALPQALLAGKPAISYDIDGAREVVIENETGILLPPRSIDQLAEAVIRLANDSDLRIQMGRAGRLLCETRFDHGFMTEQIRNLYVRILNQSSRKTL